MPGPHNIIFFLSCHCRAQFNTMTSSFFPSPLLPLTDNVDVLLQFFIIYVFIRFKVAHGHLGPLAQDRSNMVASYPTIQGMLKKGRVLKLEPCRVNFCNISIKNIFQFFLLGFYRLRNAKAPKYISSYNTPYYIKQ